MQVSMIASGSNGNSCLVEDKKTSLMIDAGKSCKELEFRMDRLGKRMEDVDAILITHSHTDHISGAGIVSRRYNIPVYMTNDVYLESRFALGNFERRYFPANREFKIKNLYIKPVQTSHDVASCGFRIGDFAILTDTGMVTKQMEDMMPKLKAALLESNHDIDMLVNGHYPYHLKQRIMSDKGHLSNVHASTLIQSKGKKLNLALLGHLSGNNNTPDIVRETFETLVKKRVEYAVCSRDKESGVWEL